MTTNLPRSWPLAAGLLVLAGLLMPPGPAEATGVPPGSPVERTYTYSVATRGDVQADVGTFRRIARRTFNDRRGWTLGGSLRYRQVSSGGDFTLWLASPSQMSSFSSVCSGQYSCRVGDNVIINDERWRRGTSTWPHVREYRPYVLNHELGHWLGLDHRSCPASGTYAPVMQQQSISLEGCTTNTWPLAEERREAANRHGVRLYSRRDDVYAIQQQGGTGTEVHALQGDADYSRFALHSTTRLGRTDPARWEWTVVDHDADGVDDLFGILRDGGSGSTEVHVLDGASGYRRWLEQTATALYPTPGDDFSFDVSDINGDGHLDVVALAHRGGSGTTEVHVLDGARRFQRWIEHTATALHRTNPSDWTLRMGDHDRDGVPDVYAINRAGGSGQTEVHVLDGARRWQRFSMHRATPLPRVGDRFDFVVGDLDGDGYTTVFAIDRSGGSRSTEVHVLDDFQYNRWALHAATALHPTRDMPHWRFAVD